MTTPREELRPWFDALTVRAAVEPDLPPGVLCRLVSPDGLEAVDCLPGGVLRKLKREDVALEWVGHVP